MAHKTANKGQAKGTQRASKGQQYKNNKNIKNVRMVRKRTQNATQNMIFCKRKTRKGFLQFGFRIVIII